jgi:hypothetical protein
MVEGKLFQTMSAGLIGAFLILSPERLVAQIEILAVEGQVAPDGNGNFLGYLPPAINDHGTVAFEASFTNTNAGFADDRAVLRGDADSLAVILREGQPTPDGNGIFGNIFNVRYLNNANQIAFNPSLTGTSGGSADDQGIFRLDALHVAQIVREGQPTPSSGTFGVPTSSLNENGHAAFFAGINGVPFGTNIGIFRGDGTAVTQITRTGHAAPDGNGTFTSLFYPAINDLNQVAFKAGLTGINSSGVFRGDGVSFDQIARTGDFAPGGNGQFSHFGAPALNDSGQLAFAASLQATSGGAIDNQGMYRSNGIGAVQIARKGQTAPDGNGVLSDFQIDWPNEKSPALNDNGQVLFYATLTDTVGGFFEDDEGIFLGDGISLIQIAREGDLAPGGTGFFGGIVEDPFEPAPTFENLALNNSGQVAFKGHILGGTHLDDQGLFFYDDTMGLVKIVRSGDPLLGSTITNVDFVGSTGSLGEEGSGLNDSGQVAFRFTLADFRGGIAIWSSSSPSIEADYNSDGRVDAADYVVWRKNPSIGSYSEWRANFGRTVDNGGTLSALQVPEPAILVLAVFALVPLLANSRRNRNARSS